MTSVQIALEGVSKLAVDTAPLIYFIEKHPNYLKQVREILGNIDNGRVQGYTSVITLTEVLTHPKRVKNDDMVETYRRYLLGSRNFELISITPEIAEIASDIRAKYGLKTPDALQIASALTMECQAILTNDQGLSKVSEIKIILIEDLTV